MESTGGKLIRDLRNERKITMEQLAHAIGMERKTLHKIEKGETKQPRRATLEQILSTLSESGLVELSQRNEIYASFGYKMSYPRPSEDEQVRAVEQWRNRRSEIPSPAYLIDCAQNLLDWNIYAPRLLGLSSDNVPEDMFRNVTIYDVAFDLGSSFVEIVNREEYLSQMVKDARQQDYIYREEDWYASFIEESKSKHKEFARYWDRVKETEINSITLSYQVPIELRVLQTDTVLKFTLVRIYFASDPRFYTVQWYPEDKLTMSQCLMWAESEDLLARKNKG